MHKVCYLLLSLSLWCCSFSGFSAPSNDNKAAQTTANQLTYQQLFELQNRLAQLEAEFKQQQNTKADLKDAEKDLLDLKQQLSALKVLVENDDKNQDRRLSDFTERFNVVKERITDTQSTMNWWLSGLTFLLVLVGYLAYRQSKQEAKQLAQQQMETFIAENKPKLLAAAQEELATTKQGLEAEIEVLRKQVSLSQDELKQHVEDIKKLKELAKSQVDDLLSEVEQTQTKSGFDNNTEVGSDLTEQQKKQLNLATQLKPVKEFDAEDWYLRSGAQLANRDYSGALISIKKALKQEAALTDLNYARYLFRKAYCYFRLDKHDDGIKAIDLLLERFSDSGDRKIQFVVAHALNQKAITHRKCQKNIDAIASCDLLLNKFINSDDPNLQQQVAMALHNKAVSLGQLQRPSDVIACYDILQKKFHNSSIPFVKDELANAYANSAEIALLLESPAQVLARVNKCEQMTIDPQELTVMQFVRFILDDKPITAVLASIRQIPSDFELTWQFSEIKPYIEANISGEKLQQCHAIMAFFEDHKDIKRLAKELGLN